MDSHLSEPEIFEGAGFFEPPLRHRILRIWFEEDGEKKIDYDDYEPEMLQVSAEKPSANEVVDEDDLQDEFEDNGEDHINRSDLALSSRSAQRGKWSASGTEEDACVSIRSEFTLKFSRPRGPQFRSGKLTWALQLE